MRRHVLRATRLNRGKPGRRTRTTLGLAVAVGALTALFVSLQPAHAAGVTAKGVTFDENGGVHAFNQAANPSQPSADAGLGKSVQCDGACDKGWVLYGNGDIHVFGSESKAPANLPHWDYDIARDFKVVDPSKGGYILDGQGGLHKFTLGGGKLTDLPDPSGGPYWGYDIARSVVVSGNHFAIVMDGQGGLFAVGLHDAAPTINTSGAGYWSYDIARDLTMSNDGKNGFQMDGQGGIFVFATAANALPDAASGQGYWSYDIARRLVLADGNSAHGGYQLDGQGGLFAFASGSNDAPVIDTPPDGYGSAAIFRGIDTEKGA